MAARYRVEDMLVWGETSGADALCWITVGEPDEWPVAVWERHGGGWAVYACGMVEFLLKVIRAEFDRCPFSEIVVWGDRSPRFLHEREEERLFDTGIDPWTGEPHPYPNPFAGI